MVESFEVRRTGGVGFDPRFLFFIGLVLRCIRAGREEVESCLTQL